MEKSIHRLTFYHPVVEKIANCLEEAFIVGGFVRDRILGVRKDAVDIDIVITKGSLAKAQECLSRVLKVKPFCIRRRVLRFTGENWQVDVSEIKGSNLEEDLRSRDFTVNAIAVSLNQVVSPLSHTAELFDPTDGLKDLWVGLIRLASPTAIKDDPLRILRGVRLKLELSFSFHRDFVKESSKHAVALKSVPGSRLGEELTRILKVSPLHTALKELQEVSALEPVFGKVKGVEKALLRVKRLEEEVFPLKEELFDESLTLHLAGEILPSFTRYDCLKLITFHADSEPERVAQILKNLGFGKKSSKMARVILENIELVRRLKELPEDSITYKEMAYRFFSGAKSLVPCVLMLFLSESESIKTTIPFVKKLSALYVEKFKNLQPLLTGCEIAKLKNLTKPHRCIGKIKSHLLKLQALGTISTREEAKRFVLSFKC